MTRVREQLVEMRPAALDLRHLTPAGRRGLTDPFTSDPRDAVLLICVRLDDGRYAGSAGIDIGTGEIGGQLAPHARGQGLGAELFGATAVLGHQHVGLRTLRAGYEPTSIASARALTRAGFVPDDGPTRYTLPNGREIEARWVSHTATESESCCAGHDA
nr:GNAT family protein [Streptomyces sp. SID14478]